MNWHVYWISAAGTAVVIAAAMAWHTGKDPAWKESEASTDMLINLVCSAIAGALWPLTAAWLLLNVINGHARAARKKPD